MGAYEYQALDARGRRRRGVATGDSAKLLRQQLREQGLTPLKVVPVQERSASGQTRGGARGGRQKITSTELAVITRQFAILLESGMTIEAALSGLVAQVESHRVKSTLSGVRSMIMEGRSLAEALRSFPRSFPELYTASVAAGEQTGHLDKVLERLADYTEARQGLKQRIGVALVYPVILTVVSILIVVGLMTYVVPQVVRVFEDTGQTLPLLTRVLIGMSEFLQRNGPVILAVIVAVVLTVTIVLRYPKPKYAFHKLLLTMPGTRRLSRGLNTARMARTLAILIGSGVPLLSALRSSADVVLNLVLRENLLRAADEVEQGASLSRALGRRDVYPPLFIQMVASGEASGQLDTMLDKAANVMEKEMESRIAVITSLFEPIMILVMGAVVLVIVMAILLPIFDLNQLIQ